MIKLTAEEGSHLKPSDTNVARTHFERLERFDAPEHKDKAQTFPRLWAPAEEVRGNGHRVACSARRLGWSYRELLTPVCTSGCALSVQIRPLQQATRAI